MITTGNRPSAEWERFIGALADSTRDVPLRTVERVLQRTASVSGLDLLVHRATGGRLSMDQVIDARTAGERGWRAQLDSVDADLATLGSLAYVLALQGAVIDERATEPVADDGRRVARALLDHVAGRGGLRSLRRTQVLLYLDLLTLLGTRAEVEAVMDRGVLPESMLGAYRLDLENPLLHPAGEWSKWLDRLAEFLPASLGAVSVQPDAPTLFDGLWAHRRPVADGPLVSVVVSAYNPGRHLLSSVMSVLRQSHENLEVIVVDDASEPGSDEVFAEVAGLDPRVRVLRLRTNGGTYRCRNYALSVAHGNYVTFHDDDDWAHPDRIAHQVSALRSSPGVVANTTRCVRATNELSFVRVGFHGTRVNVSSLMLDRRTVLRRVGFFDPVRKGADSEYLGRVRAAFGDESLADLDNVLAIVRVGQESLSSGDFRPGWSHASRYTYRSFFERFHSQVSDGAVDPLQPSAGAGPRLFPAPQVMVRKPPVARSFDVVVVTDWRRDGVVDTDGLLITARSWRADGLTVGLAHLELVQTLTPTPDPPDPAALQAVEDEVVDWVLLDEPATAGLVLCPHPAVLQLHQPHRSSWQVTRLELIEPRGCDGLAPGDHLLPDLCAETAELIFGRRPTWRPVDDLARAVQVERVREETAS